MLGQTIVPSYAILSTWPFQISKQEHFPGLVLPLQVRRPNILMLTFRTCMSFAPFYKLTCHSC